MLLKMVAKEDFHVKWLIAKISAIFCVDLLLYALQGMFFTQF